MQIFLTPNEITLLTGYKRKTDQRKQLQHLGISFYVNKFGHPVVVKESLTQESGVRPSVNVDAMPDLEALRGIENGA